MTELDGSITEKIMAASWSKQHYGMMNEGGIWVIPRSGITFQKRDGKLMLIDTMPWQLGMPLDAASLVAAQEADYQAIKENFERAGIPVEKETA